MSRITKWKVEKTKVKVVFRLQFHATHIPQSGWDKLFISFIPSDSGKATAKTTKTNVRSGACKWADPIYETTRLLQDSKTKRYDDKLCKLVVATGSSRSSVLGEADINLADYVDALKPFVVSLPLHGTNSGTILHVTVQLLTSKTGFREFEQQRELRERGLLATADQNSHVDSAGGKALSSEDAFNEQLNKGNARVKFKSESKEHCSLEEGGLNEECTGSAAGFDGSSNTSESLYAEKHETSSTHEIDSLKSTISGDIGGHSFNQSPRPEKGDPSDHQYGWGSDYSVDNDLAIAYEETSRLRGSLEATESSIFELKMEVNSLQNHANEISAETQKFTEQISAEIASGEELAKEVSLLKSESLRFRDDLEHLKSYKAGFLLSNEETKSTNCHSFPLDLQFKWLKGFLVVEEKLRELQSKVCFGAHEEGSSLLQPEFDALLGVLQDLQQGIGGATFGLPMATQVREEGMENREIGLQRSEEKFVSGTGFDVDLKAEKIGHPFRSFRPVSHDSDSTDATHELKEKLFGLLKELDESKAEKHGLVRKMDQMECYYEALVQELEETQKQVLGELQNLRNEHSTCQYTISSAKAQTETMHRDMTEHISRFAADRDELESLNKELERRAINSEAALKRARLNYSIAVDQLQKDLELLSFQVLSMFETNESLIKQTYAESSKPCTQGYLGMVQGHDLDACKLLKSQKQHTGLQKQSFGGDILLEDWKKSLQLQGDLYQKVEEELGEMQMLNVHLDVFSKTLQETLFEAVADIDLMKKRIFELKEQLELSNKSEELLMQRLQDAMNNVNSLSVYKANSIASCNDFALQNQTLEAELGCISNENCLLRRKVTDLEAIVEECSSYESKFQVSTSEKMELEKLLKQKTIENGTLQNEKLSLEQEMKTFKAEYKELASTKENLQQILEFLWDKLGNLLASYDEKLNGHSLWSKSLSRDMESKDFVGVVSQLEQFQHSVRVEIRQLLKQKKDLEAEKDIAQASIKAGQSELLLIRQKFEHDLQDMINKFNMSNALLQKLQLEINAVANKINIKSEAEENYLQQNSQLFSDLARLECELEQVTSENNACAGDISLLETITEELNRSKLTIAEFTKENNGLKASLQDKSEESGKLIMELNNLKGNLEGLQNELHVESVNRERLEAIIADLSNELNEKHNQLVQFDQQKAEMVHFKQLASELEVEKSRVSHILMHTEDRLQKMCTEASTLTRMDSQLSQTLELLIASDIEVIITRLQYEGCVGKLIQKLQSSDKQIRAIKNEHFDVDERLNQCLTSEKQCFEENLKLLASLESTRSDLDACVTQNRVLMDVNSTVVAKVDEYKNQAAALEISLLKDRSRHVFEVEQLEHMLTSFKEEIDNLVVSLVEQETKSTIFEAILDEWHASSTFLEEYDEKLVMLQNQCNELSHKLNEQILKTEEFKNLSIHFKELKDKAEANCIQARDKRESDSPSVATQEPLRIAFIREQYETKLQDLKHQLTVSKKHGEDMLCRLQDAVDEIENRKKSEACHLKKNEELALKILELENELTSVLSDKRENLKAYDRLKAETECSLMTLECTKEERQMLEASLRECNEEKCKIADELRVIKELLDSSHNPINVWKEGSSALKVELMPKKLSIPMDRDENPTTAASNDGITRDVVSENGSTRNLYEEIDECSTGNKEEGRPNALMSKETMQGVNGISRLAPVDQQEQLHRDAKQLSLMNDHLKAQNLQSSMEYLQKELERLINENSLSSENNYIDCNFQGLQGELMRLYEANKELGNRFPLFKEFPVNGNALERVLALEIELAEALQSKNKSSFQFQSSFLKQHSDEEAIFQSFRDINELIKDMLELKGRNAAVENELREMHNRYSQLSLQFAEVEGERQKLMMTLKNVRASKTVLLSNHTPGPLGNHPA